MKTNWMTVLLPPVLLCLPALAGAAEPAGERHAHGRLRQDLEDAWHQKVVRAEARFGVSLLAGGAWTRPEAGWPAKAVLLVHGLDEPGAIWNDLVPALVKAGHAVLRLDYPDDQPIEASSGRLEAELRTLRQRGVEELDIVAHSMGGLVAMDMLTDPAPAGSPPLPRVRRLITVGTPWGGSPMARLRGFLEVRETALRALDGRALLLDPVADGHGEAGADLRPGSAFLRRLAGKPTPEGLRFTLIAGNVGADLLQAADRKLDELEEARPGLARIARRTRNFIDRSGDKLGDGMVPLPSALARPSADTIILRATHSGMLRAKDGAAPARPVILERLGSPGAASRQPGQD